EDLLEQKHQSQLKKERVLEHGQRKLHERREQVDKRSLELEGMIQQQMEKLHEISTLNREEAEKLLLERLDKELANEIAARLQKHEGRLRSASEEKAREILATSIQRYAAEHTADTTVSTVDIPSDDMKGRIIGREGRNIRTFEKCTGVDVIVDDTPGVVIVSAFDNVRRETARLALTKLIQDGRIHPSRIEEVVTETQQEMEKHIMEVGKQAVLDANVGPVHEKLTQLMGRLRFRTSYSQNVLQHSLEVAHLCGMMEEELGLDGRVERGCRLRGRAQILTTVRHPVRARRPRDRQCLQGSGQRSGQSLRRHRQCDRKATKLPGGDQGDRRPRDQSGGVCTLSLSREDERRN